MKTLRTAALVVGAVALVASGIGAAGAIGAFGTIAAGSAAAGTLATIATIATIASVASSALALAAALTAKRPPLTGSPTTFNSDPSAGIPYLMGRTWNAGNIVYWDTNDTRDKGDNDRQTFVVILSGAGPVQEIEDFYSDQVVIPFTEAGAALGFYNGFMWQKTQLGLTPEAAALSIPADPAVPPGWTAAHKLSGYAAAMWRMRFDTKGKKYQNGTPKPGWVVKGVKVYDPRLDSTYPGGSGPCRALNESTYVWSENPYLHALTWCLGRWQNGIRVLGIGALLACIDVPAFVEGANVADLNGWKIGGVAYSTDGKWDTLVNILQAGCGEPLALGAKISCFVNAPKVSLDTITVADLSGAVSVQATQARRDRINGIIPRYRSEAHKWEVVSAAPVRVPAYVTFDGGERTKEADYVFVQNVDQAATLARYGIENAREFGPISMPLRPRWIGYKPGDAVTVVLPEVGLNGQKVLLTNRDIDPATGCPRFAARSETDGKHPFALGQTTVAPPTPGVTGPPVNPVPAETAWNIVGTAIEVDGTVLPALIIDGSIDSTSADSIVFEYREAVDGLGVDDGWVAAGIEPPETTRKIITGLKPMTSYQASVVYRRDGVLGDRLILGPVQTPQLALDGSTTIGGQPIGVYISDLAQVQADLTITVPTIFDLVKSVGVLNGIMQAKTTLDGKAVGTVVVEVREVTEDTVETLSLIGAKNGAHTAFIMNLETVKVSPTMSLAQKFTQLQAYTDSGLAALSTSLSTAITDGDSALASQIDSVEASISGPTGLSAQVTFLKSATVDVSGSVVAKAVLSLIAGPAGSQRVGGIIATNTGVLTTLDLNFDAVRIFRPDGLLLFTTAGGKVYAPNLVVDTLQVNTAVVPVRTTATSAVVGTHTNNATTPTPGTVLEVDIYMPVAGWIEANATMQVSYAGPATLQYNITIDGVQPIEAVGGQGATVGQSNWPCQGARKVSAGWHTVQLNWNGFTDVTLYQRSLWVKGFTFSD